MRVVSLLPSATELLCAAGGQHTLVGRSHECDFPAGLEDIPVLTAARTTHTDSADIDKQVRAALDAEDTASLYSLDTKLLAELKPDVILTQDLCNVWSIDLNAVRRVVASMDNEPEIVSLNPRTMEDIFDDVIRVGEAAGCLDGAQKSLVHLREQYWSAVDYVNPYTDGPTTAFLEWMDPLFVAGHWTPQLITAAGGRPVLMQDGEPSKQINPEDLLEAMPQCLIICPCGYDIAQTTNELHTLTSQRWWKLIPAVLDDQVWVVDGNQMFSRPGPRLVDAFRWLVALLSNRPEVLPEAFPAQRLSAIKM